MSEEAQVIQRIAHDLIGDLSIDERRQVVAHLVDEYGAGKTRAARRIVEMQEAHREELLHRGLTFMDLCVANAKRCEDVFHPIESWTPTDWACAMAGEAGEACNLVKKLRRGEDIQPGAIGHELADVVIYADLLCTRLGINLGELVRSKFNVVSERRGSEVKL